jgi:hypothetical protein
MRRSGVTKAWHRTRTCVRVAKIRCWPGTPPLPARGTAASPGATRPYGWRYPGYVRRASNGAGGLAIAGERTGRIHDSYNHQSLAIFTSVARHGELEAAIVMEGPGGSGSPAGR